MERFALQTESKDLLFEMLKDRFAPNDCTDSSRDEAYSLTPSLSVPHGLFKILARIRHYRHPMPHD
ncbi:MAG: hypothetical protein WAK33_11780, partial [Silvibacterium sp.]